MRIMVRGPGEQRRPLPVDAAAGNEIEDEPGHIRHVLIRPRIGIESDQHPPTIATTVNGRSRDATMRQAGVVQRTQGFHDRQDEAMDLFDGQGSPIVFSKGLGICWHDQIDTDTVVDGASRHDRADALTDIQVIPATTQRNRRHALLLPRLISRRNHDRLGPNR